MHFNKNQNDLDTTSHPRVPQSIVRKKCNPNNPIWCVYLLYLMSWEVLFLLPVYINMEENREKGGVEGKGEEGREEEMEKERKSKDPHTWQ